MGRLCKRCGESFYPTGKSCKICERCKNKGSLIRREHSRQTILLRRAIKKLKDIGVDKKI